MRPAGDRIELNPTGEAALDEAIDRFESAWERGEPPEIGEFLPTGLSPRARRQWLYELAHVDLERRFQRGEDVRMEEYFTRFPELMTKTRRAVSLIRAEYEQRSRRERDLSWSEYQLRFPQYADQLLLRWRFGRFRLLSRIGTGGFGVVWKAHDTKLDRIIALKIPRAGQGLERLEVQRFLREGRSAARLRHPGIVMVYEAGRHRGTPYLASEYIEGGTLADALAQRSFSCRDAVQIVAQLADALAYTHTMGVVHRDLKPSNIALPARRVDDEAAKPRTRLQPRLMDFGLARREAIDATLTVDGQVLGTPAYMSPEQASGRAGTIDFRTDIYSLGVVFYQLLTGTLPFQGTQPTLLDRVIREEPRSLRLVNDAIPADLEAVCLKCLEKQPERRYATAAELADDLRRWLDGHPTRVRPQGPVTRVLRWGARKPLAAALLAVCLLAVGAVLGVNAWRVRELSSALRESDQLRTVAEEERAIAAAQRERAARWLYAAEMRWAHEHWKNGRLVRMRQTLAQYDDGAPDAALRGFEWHYLHRLAHNGCMSLVGHRGMVYAALSVDDEGTAITGGEDGTIRLWEGKSGRCLKTIPAHDSCVNSLAISPAGDLVASTSCDGTVKLWGFPGLSDPALLTKTQFVGNCCRFSPDGRLLATALGEKPGGKRGEVLIWDVAERKLRCRVSGVDDRVESLAFHPEGRLLALCSSAPELLLVDVERGQRRAVQRAFDGEFQTIAFSTTGLHLITVSHEHSICVWNVPDLTLAHKFGPRRADVGSMDFSSDGSRLFVGYYDGTVEQLGWPGGERISQWRFHPARIWDLACSRDGRTVVTGGEDGSATLVQPLNAYESQLLTSDVPATVEAAFSRDGRSFLLRHALGDQVWDLSQALAVRSDVAGRGAGQDGAPREFAEALRRLSPPFPEAWNPSTWTGPMEQGMPPGQSSIGSLLRDGALSADGSTFVRVLHEASTYQVETWSVADQTRIRQVTLHDLPRVYKAISHNGRFLVVEDGKGNAELWEVASQSRIAPLTGHNGTLKGVAFAPADDRLVTTGGGQAVVWEIPTARPISRLDEPIDRTEAVTFSSDGRRIVTGSSPTGQIQIWDAETGQELLTLDADGCPVWYVTLSGDGQALVSLGRNAKGESRLLLWSGRPGDPPASKPAVAGAPTR